MDIVALIGFAVEIDVRFIVAVVMIREEIGRNKMNYTIGELYNLGFETRLATGETEWYAEPTGKYYIQDGEAKIIKRYKDCDLLRCKRDNSVWLFKYRESEVDNEKV